jgi:2',3'-cyclic-nucleotide 2'-phosphodiesterase (5'-nucleotidase family)
MKVPTQDHARARVENTMNDTQVKSPISRRHFVGLAATAAASTAVYLTGWGSLSSRTAYAAGDAILTLVHTNDVHSYVDVAPFVKGLKDSLAANGAEHYVISAGDDFAGTPFASLSAGQDVAVVMNEAGYDMFAIGNHEYMMLPTDLQAVFDVLNFPILACNALPSTRAASPYICDYQVVEFANTKVAFIGIAFNQPGAPDLYASVEAARQAAADEGATVFVGISHLGVDGSADAILSTEVAEQCPWFSVIIDGHSHTVLPVGLLCDNNVLVVQTGCYGENIGVTELAFDGSGSLTGATASLIAIKGHEDTCGITPDASIQSYIASVNERNSAYVNAVVFSLPVMLNGQRNLVRTQETSLGNVVADAMLAKTGAQIALVSGASLRNDLGPGEITRGVLQSTLLAETQLALVELSGTQLMSVLEDGVGIYPEPYPVFPHISGMRMVFAAEKDPGERVVYAALADGTRITESGSYRVAVREDLAYFYLGALDADSVTAGIDYEIGYGMQSEAVAEYIMSGVSISGETDGRLQMRGSSYLIRFDGNGAISGEHAPITVSYDEVVALPANTYARSGYRFTGWIDDTGVKYADQANLANYDVDASGEVVLYAQWERLETETGGGNKEPVDGSSDSKGGDGAGDGAGDETETSLPNTGDGTFAVAATAVAALTVAGTALCGYGASSLLTKDTGALSSRDQYVPAHARRDIS